MESVTVSTKYQVVIPRKVRKLLNVNPGQKMRVIAYENQIILIPIRPITEARGALKDIDTDVQREDIDRI